VEGVHQDVVFSLEDKHVVEGATDTQGHSVGERTLTERIDEEDSRSSSDRSTVSNTDPRSHAETVGEFPLTTHVAVDADEEVEDYELERTTVVKPFIEGSSFPDGVEVKSNSIGTRNDSTRDDVVTIHERTSDGFTNTIDVHWGSSDECYDKADGCCQQSWDHQHTKPTYIQAVVS